MSREQIRTAIQGAVQYLSQHPTEARYTDSAATAVLEGGLRCRVVGKNSDTATTDMPASVGGGGSAPSPGWLFRAAQASCGATPGTMHAAVQGVSLTRLEVAGGREAGGRGNLWGGATLPAGP